VACGFGELAELLNLLIAFLLRFGAVFKVFEEDFIGLPVYASACLNRIIVKPSAARKEQ
jgi:hypothetical protein